MGNDDDVAFYAVTQTQWMGDKQRFITVGLNGVGLIDVVQLQFENRGYAELRSVHKLGHRERNDSEVKQEEAKR